MVDFHAFIINLFVYKLLFNTIPEIVAFGYELGEVLSKICMAIITGYIFYSIVHQYKADDDKENQKPFIVKRLTTIIGYSNNLMNQFTDTEVTFSFPPSLDEIRNACNFIDRNSEFLPKWVKINSGIAEKFDWHQFLFLNKSNTIYQINLLYKIQPINSSLLKITSEIYESDYFFTLDQMNLIYPKVGYKKIDISESLHKYILLNHELLIWAINNDFVGNEINKDLKKKILKNDVITERDINM